MNLTPERILSSYDEMVDMGMKALVEEAAANSGGSAGAGKDWGHEEISVTSGPLCQTAAPTVARVLQTRR